MNILKKLADNTRPNSVSNRFRKKRFAFFKKFIADLSRPVKILDIGGTQNFWKQMGYLDDDNVSITILNLEMLDASRFSGIDLRGAERRSNPINETIDLRGAQRRSNPMVFNLILGDARNLSQFSDKEFDVAFSNSVIEHVGDFTDQKKMAVEIMRVGKRYFVQTPNYYFPFEPHFLFPLFQFLPASLKIFLVKNFNMGWYGKTRDAEKAEKLINSIKLLKRADLKKLFPQSGIYSEKLLGLTKSFIVYK